MAISEQVENEKTIATDSNDYRNRGLTRWRGLIETSVFYVLLLAVLEIGIRQLGIPSYILPTPSEIASAVYHEFAALDIIADMRVTLIEALAGFAIALTAGIILAALIASYRFVERTIFPLVVILQSLPKIALAPLILLWAGFGIQSKIIISALSAFFPIIINSLAGLRSYSADTGVLFESLRASKWQTFRRLRLPSALPNIFTGATIGWIFALLGAVVGEFVGAQAGLGYALVRKQFILDTPGMFAYLIVLAILGFVGERIVAVLKHRLVFWSKE